MIPKEISERILQTAAVRQWESIGIKHHHGINIPLFSIHTEKSAGIGEYLDLIPLVEWCKQVGFDVLQILPINDTGDDTSPYNSLSAIALNPIHISLHALPGIEKVVDYLSKLSKIQEWTKTPRVKYAIVRELKGIFLKEYYSEVFKDISTTPAYKQFTESNPWLLPYALFKALKETHAYQPWEQWPLPQRSPSVASFEELLKENELSVNYYTFLQYLCFEQMKQVKTFAESKQVFIKGDIPILISRDSADVWNKRYFFLLHLAAGAPPDVFNKDGQYWGFPLYDWEELEKKDFSWWKDRLTAASNLYHIYRLDHIIGFFRIWGIPHGKSAREGIFYPQDSSTWIPQGRKVLEMMIKFSPILPIGEDLGVVSADVRECMASLGICGTKVIRWERNWETGGNFISFDQYNPESMTSVSTHDSDTVHQWWIHAPKEAKLYCDFLGWDYKPVLSNEKMEKILWDSHHTNSLFHINLLPEYLSLFPELVSTNINEERINYPGKVLDINWSYRLKPSIEELKAHLPLREAIARILA